MIRLPSAKIEDFARRWNVSELSVFGSVARGEDKADSDVDIMVRFAHGETWDLLDLGQMKVELEDILARSVDLVESGTVLNPLRRDAIERDLTVVYAAA